MFDLKTLRKFTSKVYRDGYLQTQVRGKVAYQVRALRQKFGMTQEQFAKEIGKPQSVVSRLESTEYGKVSVQTLLDIASALNIAVLVQFVTYPEFLRRAVDMSPKALAPATIDESIAEIETALSYAQAPPRRPSNSQMVEQLFGSQRNVAAASARGFLTGSQPSGLRAQGAF